MNSPEECECGHGRDQHSPLSRWCNECPCDGFREKQEAVLNG